MNLPPRAVTVKAARAAFAEGFGYPPTHLAAAPGRVNLIGEHIDYCDGFVMPFALPCNVVVAAAAVPGRRGVRLRSREFDGEVEFDPTQPLVPGKPAWANLVLGVVAGFAARGRVLPEGWDLFAASDVPMGAGLSSSAAVEVAVATWLAEVLGDDIDKKDLALLAQKAEHDYAGVPCGVMDQFASTFGKEDRLLLLDCRSLEVELVPFANPELAVLVADTRVTHQLDDGGYASRRAQVDSALSKIGASSWREVTAQQVEAANLDAVEARRSRHVVSEIARTREAAECLRDGDFARLGQLMFASHASLRDDFAVSCPELDFLVEQARQRAGEFGVLGARMTGGGFGGCTVTLCRADQAVALAAKLGPAFEEQFGHAPHFFLARPSAGAGMVEGKS